MTTQKDAVSVFGSSDCSSCGWRERYDDVMNSFRWKALRVRLIRERGCKCERCGKKRDALQLHHLTYERLGCELDTDLKVVCVACHEIEDSERERSVANNRFDAYYDRCLDSWASKKYGEHWEDRHDVDLIEERFERWAERKGII